MIKSTSDYRMRVKLANRGFSRFLSRPLRIWQPRYLFAVIATCFLSIVGCGIAPAQQSVVKTKAVTSNASDRKAADTNAGSCTVKSESPVLKTDPAKAAGANESNASLSKESDEAQPDEKLTLQSPAQEDWMKDQIHLRERAAGAEESGNDSIGRDQSTEQQCTRGNESPKSKLSPAN